MKVYFVFLFTIVIALPTSAHPGKTDRYGGHKCYKECADWDLYYAEYHLHDKDGRPLKVARKKPVRAKLEAAAVKEKAVIEEQPSAAAPAPTAALAAIVPDESAADPLPWILLMLFLLLFLVVRRNRRKASGVE